MVAFYTCYLISIQLPYKQFLLTFPWQLTLPPPRGTWYLLHHVFEACPFTASEYVFDGESIFSKYLNFEWNYCPCNVGNLMKISTYAVWSNWAVQQHRKSRLGILFLKLATPLDLFGNLPQPITCCDMAYVCQSTTGQQAAW